MCLLGGRLLLCAGDSLSKVKFPFNVISAMDPDDIAQVVGDEIKLETLYTTIIERVRRAFLDTPAAETIRHLLASWMGNMPKVATDLRDDCPVEVDKAKLEYWNIR